MPALKSIQLGLSYCSVLMGMAAALFSTVVIKQNDALAGLAFFSALSFSAGIYVGDPNTISFYQYKFSMGGKPCNGYWLSRLLASAVLSLPIAMLTPHLGLLSFIVGILAGYLFPLGRVSEESMFSVIIRASGVIKLITSALCIATIFLSAPSWITITLFISGISSVYIGSIPFHLPYLMNAGIALLSTIQSIQVALPSFPKINVINTSIRDDCIFLVKNYLAGLPVHIYTTFGGFIFSTYRGAQLLPSYYLWERVLRGLGGTVLPLMSFTTSRVSLRHNLKENNNIENLFKYSILYIISGFSVSILFYALFACFRFSSFFLRIPPFEFIPIAICTTSLYISTVLGTLVLQVGHYKKYFFLSTFAGALCFPILVLARLSPSIVISLTELSVALVQIVVILYLCCRNKAAANLSIG
jgi:hypothetical protein